jgi:nucleoside permease NupC
MATLFGVIAIAVCILLIVAVSRNKRTTRTQESMDGSGDRRS